MIVQCHEELFAQLEPLALHDQPKSKDDSGICLARSLMEQGSIVHIAGDWKHTASAAEETHGSDIYKKNMYIMLNNKSLFYISSNGSEFNNKLLKSENSLFSSMRS